MAVLDLVKSSKNKDRDENYERQTKGSTWFDVDEYYKSQTASEALETLQKSLEDLYGTGNSFIESYNSRYYDEEGNYVSKYRSDSNDWLTSVSQQKSDFQEYADLIRKVASDYKKYLGNTAYTRITQQLDDFSSTYSKMYENAYSDKEFQSQFKNESDYNNWIAANKEYERKKNLNLDVTQKEIADLEKLLENANEYKYELGVWTDNAGDNGEDYYLNFMYQEIERKYMEESRDSAVYMPKAKAEYDAYVQGIKEYLKESLGGYESTEALEAEISNKKLTYNQAKRIQEKERLASVANPESANYDPEFEAYAQSGLSFENPSPNEAESGFHLGWRGEKKATDGTVNKATYARDNATMLGFGESNNGGSNLVGYNLSFMTEEEIKVYSYYFAKGEYEKADAYLKHIEESTNEEWGEKIYDQMAGQTALAKIAFGGLVGLDQFGSGLDNLFSTEDYIPTSALQVAGSNVREDLADDSFKFWYNFKDGEWEDHIFGSSVGQTAYDLTTTTSNMLPSILIGAVTHPYVGSALLGASAAGNAYQEMLNYGYDKGQARFYSTLVGVSEATLESVLGGFSALGGKATGGIVTKLLSKVDNAFARAAIRFGGSMLSEGFEEGLQEYLDPWFKSIAFNTDYEAANLDEILYSGLLGALSAFGLEGAHIVGSEVATYSKGKNIKTYGEVDRLVELGKTFSADTVAYQIASRIDKNTGAYTIGRLLNEVGASLSSQNISDIKKALVERGIDEGHAKILVKGLERVVSGEKLSEKQKAALEKNPVLADVWNEVIIEPNSTVMQRSMEYGAIANRSNTAVSNIYGDTDTVKALVEEGLASPDGSRSKALATEYSKIIESGKSLSNKQIQKLVDANSEQISTEEKVEKADTEAKASVENSSLAVSEDGRTINTKTGSNIKIKEIVSIKDGEMTLRTEDGKTVNAKDVNFSDSDALIYSAVLDMGLNAASANAIIGNYDKSGNLTAGQYFLGVKEAYKYGRYGIPVREMSLDGFSADLSIAQKSLAYRLGASDAKHATEVAQSKINEAIESRKQSGVEKAEDKGKLRFTEGEKKVLEGLSSDQKAVVDFFRDIATATPSGIKLIGYDAKANGYTNLTTGEMVFSLDSNASHNPVAALLFTAGHESGHSIKRTNPQGFKRLGEFLAQEYGKKGVSVHAHVLAMQEKSKNNLTYEETHEEWVCQSLQRMFASVINNKDSGVLERLKKYDNKVAKLLYEALSKLASKISSLLEKLTPGTFEEQFVAEMDATARKLFEAMYAEELVTALDNAQWLDGVDVMNDILGNNTIEVGKTSLQEMNRRQTRFQEKTEYEAQPKEIITVGTEAKKPKANRKTLGGRNKVTIAGKTFKGDVSVKELRDARFKENGFSQKKIDKHNEFIQHMAEMMEEARVKYRFIGLDDIYNAKILISPTSGEITLSALVNNGDYPINFDFTKVCKKRVALQQIVDQLARQKGKSNADGTVTEVNLSPENIKAINDILAEAGIETACLCCFVESKRYNIQSLVQENVIDVWNSIVEGFDSDAGYFNFADESVNESKIPDKEFDALYEQIVAWRKQTGKSSIPKEKMQQFLETTPAARKKLRFSDLVTENGRTNLHKLYPDIEGLIGSTLGTAAPKSVEAFAPYNGEIDLMESTGETGMREYLFSIAGARSQSFSDFMIAHIFDVVQKTASLSARKFPAHVYTKEIARARLFGMTGEKHNMSVLFNIDPEVDSWDAGLKKDGSYFLSDYKAYKSGESQYIQSIGWDDAVNLQNTEGYSKDCGIIAVGFSYNNMVKIHNDPDVRQVIGYHTSSLPAVVKPLTHLDKATDYTPVQNTLAFVGFVKPMYAIPEGVPSYATPPQDVQPTKGNAKTRKVSDTFDIKATFKMLAKGKKGEARTQAAKETLRQLLEYAESNGLALKTKKAEGGHGDFDLYSDVSKTKNPYMSADHYIEYCIERGYLPAFFEFSMNPNYYKDIFDFNVFDRLSYNPETGLHEDSAGRQAYAPQTAVHMLNEDGSYAFPSDFFDIVDKQMKNYDEYSQMVESKMPAVMEAITSIDGMTSNLKLQAKELQQKDPKMLTENDLLSLLEFSKAKAFQDGSFIPVRINTPQILIEFAKSFGHTLENHPLAMNVYKARQALSNVENWDGRLKDKPHNLTAEEVVEIIKAMNNPSYLVFQTENDRFAEIVRFVREGEKEKAYAVIDFFDVDKNPALMNGYKGGKYNILVTIYPSENNDELKSYLHNKNHKVMTGEEMKKKGLSQRGLGSQVPAHLSDSPFFDDSLSQTTKKSQERKYQERDSEGNTLSKGQQEFFKESKVRDENGNLLKVFHGTPKKFTIFRQGVAEGWGEGIYFTDNPDAASEYGENIVGAYLNIKNPYNADTMNYYDIGAENTKAYQDFDKKYWQRWYDEYDTYEEYRDDGMGVEIDMIYTEYVDVFNKILRELGYDGIIANGSNNIDGLEIVAFHENQPKLTTNRNPTYDPDIRYQERATEDISNRSLLANALESAAAPGEEKNLLRNYKSNIRLIEAEQKKLSEIKDKLFAKGSKIDPEERKKLQSEMKQAATRINSYDRQLLKLEAMQPIKKVLAREKDLAKKRQKQKDMQILADYKERSKATVKELMKRNQESRQKAIEGRDKTLMRHKIKGVVNELNQLLLKGTKERHVLPGLQSAVASALKAINMDTVGADKRIAELNAKIAKAKDPDVIESLTATRDRIQNQGDVLKDKLEALEEAYTEIEDRGNEIPEYYRRDVAVIKARILSVKSAVGNTSIRNMSLAQLESVYELYSMVLTTVRNANKVFVQGKLEDLQRNATATMEELSAIKKRSEERYNTSWLDSFSWNEMIPVYAFRRMGSNTFERFFWEAIRGQNTMARDQEEAKNFATEAREKYGYSKWDFNKVHEFKLKDGRTFRINLKHMMSIYAYSKRNQALDHMSRGGFFFNDKETFRKKGGVLEIVKKNEVGYCIDSETLEAIKEAMTDKQRLYVDEMQDFLTKMGEKGNEVSRAVWGIDIFKEKVYFPLKSVKDFIFQANQTAQESSLKNDGMTKETKPGASNPIVLEAFDEVWANHVNRMSQYHGLVIPIDNLNKIHNYGTWADTESMSVSTMLGARFGEAVNDYINQFIKDLNGASSTSGASNPFFSFVGKFKKTAVAASTSVVVQQPTAILRATAVMDAKYFIGLPEAKKLVTKWNELKKYAPIAVIKEIGGFEMGSGRQATEWLNSDTKKGLDKVMNTIDDWTMKGAEIGDMVGWCSIWEAVKREIKATTNLKEGSKEFLDKAGERVTEVIVLTQVYDSTLSRSGYMRSKHDTMKMLTSFMGEPTVSMNMMADAAIQAKRGTITNRKAGRIISSVYAATILASVFASLIYGLRDDDDDESYIEKFSEALGGKLLGDLNPLNMLPGFRDIVSIFDGWDVERTDMAIFKDIKDAFNGLGSDSKSAWRKTEDLAGAIASVFGLPLKNAMRTAREIYNAVENIFDGVNPNGLKDVGDSFVEGLTGKKKDSGSDLYAAIVSGDASRLEVYRKGYKTEEAYETAVRTALRENDPRIKEAAQELAKGNIISFGNYVETISSEGYFDEEMVESAIRAERRYFEQKVGDAYEAKLGGDNEKYKEIVRELRDSYRGIYSQDEIVKIINEYVPSEEEEDEVTEETSIYKASDINAALENGDTSAALEVIDDLVRVKTENYITEGEKKKDAEKKAKSSVRSSLTSYWKPLYLAAYKSKDNAEMTRIRKLLKATKLYDDVVETCQDWVKQSKKSN